MKRILSKVLLIGCVLALLVVGMRAVSVRADAPAADFSGVPTNGAAPLTVQFTDESGGAPTGWAWYFGDETFSATWTEVVTASELWVAREEHSSVVLPDGSVLVMGGWDGGPKNDVWRSADGGVNWTRLTDEAGWSRREGHTSVVLPDGGILVMGGVGGYYKNDVWRSDDGGATWTELTASAGWSVRAYHTSVVLPDGDVLLMGGDDNDSGDYLRDVWRSADGGVNWTQLADAGWTAREEHTSVVLPDGDVLVMGGHDNVSADRLNDVWRWDNVNGTWSQLADAGWTGREGHTSVALPNGDILVMGGYYLGSLNDVWRSSDGGATWTQLTDNAGWAVRFSHTSVVLPDGDVLVMGGKDTEGHTYRDVWGLATAGSNNPNPEHIYTEDGTYSVVLQAFNADGVSRFSKQDYIHVGPTVTFDANGGEGSMDPQTAYTATSLTLNAFTRTGYAFTEWNTASDGLGTAYSDGASYDFTADITLHAQWDALPDHTVTFDANGGSGTMDPQAANVPSPLTLNAFSREGYAFTGWNTAAEGTGTAYADGATFDFAADITLYAHWEKDTFELYFPLFFN